ncbi:MAG TPA: AI-2E family transporter [Oligoflexia bacterium]|nr:AI-2E family transporter [Oligoflexia bacterium]HMP27454.1 AI-2E family transporter [Oligoflexia bacterium]
MEQNSKSERRRLYKYVVWEKIVIWGIFLGALYVLRSFFHIIFLTFLITYLMRGFVTWLINFIKPPTKTRILVERSITVIGFIVLGFTIYGAGNYLAPKLIAQGHSLVKKISASESGPRASIDSFLNSWVGGWLFQDAFGGEADERYQTALNEYIKDNPKGGAPQFEEYHKQRLYYEWRNGEVAKRIQDEIEESLVSGLKHLGQKIAGTIPRLFTLPFELLLVMLLSFFITFDIPRLKHGIKKLESSRVANIYKEIAPGLIKFGQLMGRAFGAQAVIAVVNSALTFLAMLLIGIENAVFLTAIVFVCSFIPILGVVFSSVPIGVMALIQQGGSWNLVALVILAILLIHFIETSILNPHIIGEIMHLHPVMVLAVLAIGERFFGLWGLLLATPVTVYILRVLILDEDVFSSS